MPGGATDVAVDPQNNAWVVNSAYYGSNIFRWNGSGWTLMPGNAYDISIGANGSVWIVDTNNCVDYWANNRWQRIPSPSNISYGAADIAVDRTGNPWMADSYGQTYYWYGGKWYQFVGGAADLSCGANGSIWKLANDWGNGGHTIWYMSLHGWQQVNGNAVDICADPMGHAEVINSYGTLLWESTTVPNPVTSQVKAAGASSQMVVGPLQTASAESGLSSGPSSLDLDGGPLSYAQINRRLIEQFDA
jgi:hypothetical protein